MSPGPSPRLCLVLLSALILSAGVHAAEPAARLMLACRADSDLYRALCASGTQPPRYDTPAAAVTAAPDGAGVLVLADGYPAQTTAVPDAVFEQALSKRLRMYVEYPAALPGLKCEPPRGTRAERGVVASDFFSRELGPGRILAINGLHFVPVAVEKSHLVAARVAGFDSAAFGLPKQTYPLLYTTNFAWLGLHEAAAAGDQQAAEAEAKLAAFLCRIQVRSETQPALDGGWFRAFDFRRWEPWGSNADAGWGAWAIESGWTQGWITSVFGMRQMKTSLWDLTAETRIARHFDRLRREMLPDAALAANFLRAHRVGIFLPKRVEFSVSDDGRTFQPIGQVEPAAPARDMTPQTVRLTVTVQKTVTRFVRLQAENFGPLPSWVIAGSVPAWLFAGEFLVNYKPATGCTPDKGTQQTDMEITDP